jgi:hypothetical protein
VPRAFIPDIKFRDLRKLIGVVSEKLTTTGGIIMRYAASIAAALGAAALIASTPASATIVNFSVTGDDTASWIIDDSLGPDSYDADTFAYTAANYTLNGSTPTTVGITFFDDAFGGGIDGAGLGLLSAQLFSGPTSAPTFLLGTFSAVGFPNSSLSYTVTITADRGVPEPSTWAMILLGFGATGASLRWRRRRAAAEAIA